MMLETAASKDTLVWFFTSTGQDSLVQIRRDYSWLEGASRLAITIGILDMLAHIIIFCFRDQEYELTPRLIKV